MYSAHAIETWHNLYLTAQEIFSGAAAVMVVSGDLLTGPRGGVDRGVKEGGQQSKYPMPLAIPMIDRLSALALASQLAYSLTLPLAGQRQLQLLGYSSRRRGKASRDA